MSDIATSNAEAVAAELDRWATTLRPMIYDNVGPLADILVQRARQVVPVVSGDLRASLAPQHTEGGLNVVADVDYAGWVEFGGTRGRPYVAEGRYVYPAVVARQDELGTWLDQTVQQSIDRYPWTKPTGG
jgi:hypothetical protein